MDFAPFIFAGFLGLGKLRAVYLFSSVQESFEQILSDVIFLVT